MGGGGGFVKVGKIIGVGIFMGGCNSNSTYLNTPTYISHSTGKNSM